MKKRIMSLVLSVVLLVSFFSVGAVKANAASNLTPSDECIDMLKAFEGFCAKPYWDYSQYTIGYGTVCPSEHYDRYVAEGISEEEAEQLLRSFLTGMCNVINSFADQNGITLTQQQFDALVLFTYNCGSGWMRDSEGMFKNAVVQGKTGNDFIFAIVRWCVAGDDILEGLVRRRLSEANLYINGVYSTAFPSNYGYVRYDANGGSTPYRIQGYDVQATASIIPTPTRAGCLFDGWYTAKTGGSKVTKLDSSVRNTTLYARWLDSNGNVVSGSAKPPVADEGTAIDPVKVTVTNSYVNLRQGPGTNYAIVGEANQGDQFTITATASGSGYKWGKFEDGWLALTYTNFDDVLNGTADKNETAKGEMGTVTSDDGLRIRSGAGTNNSIVGFLSYNERVEILDKKTVGGTVWGKISSGWISLDYVKLDSSSSNNSKPEETKPQETKPQETTPPETTKPTEPEQTKPETSEKKMGTITGDDLRIRTGPSTAYSVVGYLNSGDRVEILEQKTSGSMVWGKISNGWISMSYVRMDSDTTESKPGESKPSESKPSTDNSSNSSTANETGKVVYTDSLRIRSGPSTDYSIVGYLSGGTSVTITQRTTTGSMEWGKISNGWISLDYVEFDSSSSEAVGGTVIADDFLRIRSGPSTSYSIAGYLDAGDHVLITERKTVGGMEWGKISKGWISMDYIRLDGETSNSGNSGNSGSTESNANTMTVIADCLNVRSGAGTSNSVVDYYWYGQKVTILETTTAGGQEWGKTDAGWICMDYVK